MGSASSSLYSSYRLRAVRPQAQGRSLLIQRADELRHFPERPLREPEGIETLQLAGLLFPSRDPREADDDASRRELALEKSRLPEGGAEQRRKHQIPWEEYRERRVQGSPWRILFELSRVEDEAPLAIRADLPGRVVLGDAGSWPDAVPSPRGDDHGPFDRHTGLGTPHASDSA